MMMMISVAIILKVHKVLKNMQHNSEPQWSDTLQMKSTVGVRACINQCKLKTWCLYVTCYLVEFVAPLNIFMFCMLQTDTKTAAETTNRQTKRWPHRA